MFSCKMKHFQISTSTHNLNWSSQMECIVLTTVRRCVVNNWDTLRETNFQSCKNSLRNRISKNVNSFEFLPQFIKPGCLKRADHYSTYLTLEQVEPMGNKMVYLILIPYFSILWWNQDNSVRLTSALKASNGNSLIWRP